MILKELAEVISRYDDDVKIVSAFDGKIRATSHEEIKEFYDYEVSIISSKIDVSISKYDEGARVKPYLEILINDYCEWVNR